MFRHGPALFPHLFGLFARLLTRLFTHLSSLLSGLADGIAIDLGPVLRLQKQSILQAIRHLQLRQAPSPQMPWTSAWLLLRTSRRWGLLESSS